MDVWHPADANGLRGTSEALIVSWMVLACGCLSGAPVLFTGAERLARCRVNDTIHRTQIGERSFDVEKTGVY